jgi:AcrR family transcriptional regulator
MGRKRTIDQQSILDAAEQVVAKDGAANLTVEAVALQAGVSKASVLYDYKSKHALVRAVVERALGDDNAFNEEAAKGFGDARSATIRGRIAAAANPLPEQFQAVALNLCAALAQDSDLRKTVQRNQGQVIAAVVAGSDNPRGSLLAYLALEGLKLLESLDYHRWDAVERTRILQEIAWLVDQTPGQAPILPEAAQ